MRLTEKQKREYVDALMYGKRQYFRGKDGSIKVFYYYNEVLYAINPAHNSTHQEMNRGGYYQISYPA